MKHTPGPWRVSNFDGIIGIVAPGAECVVVRVASGTHNQESGANAHLIAAAPELLEACKLALEKLEWAKGRWPQSWPLDLNPKGVAEDHLKQAIAKAEQE